jgi:hypothetical protein
MIPVSIDRVHPETRAGDPFAAERKRVRESRRTEAECIEAIHEDEAQQGRPMTPSEREAFARGFFGTEYAAEIRLLARTGRLDDEDGEGPVAERELQCPACGLAWWTDGRVEYGGFVPVQEDDAYCGRCGVEGEAE